MDSSEPATEWVTLEHRGEHVAEAWFMPDGGRSTVVFLVPRTRLEADPVSLETLLDVANVLPGEVESWRLGDGSASGTGGADPGLGQPLPPPPDDDDQLTVYVTLKPAPPATDADVADLPPEGWQALEVLWKTILGLEAGIDAARLSVDGLRNEMDSAFRRQLGVDEKVNALQADVSNWTKAKSRLHHAIPKAREFVHRATWALAVPERKALDEVVRNHVVPRVPFAGLGRVRGQLEHLQKDRQLLLAQGNAVNQDCRGVLDETNRALRALQRNAADRARQKRSAGREKDKKF